MLLRRTLLAATLLVATLCLACSTDWNAIVRRAYTEDAHCASRDVDSLPLGGASYRARGCGRTAVYVCQHGAICHLRGGIQPDQTSGDAVPASGPAAPSVSDENADQPR